MINIIHKDNRGHVDHGWLQSFHTFSFGSYYDPEYMGVSSLRVINDDKVQPNNGFATHSHQDMEIISFIKKGMIEHKDSMDNVIKIGAGEFQLMSAGTGVTHSEYNPSSSESLEFLQIWILPNVKGIAPNYQQQLFKSKEGLQLIVSPDGQNGSLLIQQDAYLYRLQLEKYESISYTIKNNRTAYVHVISGSLGINGEDLNAGDGAILKSVDTIEFVSTEISEALVFDLP
ncbi:MAG: pirin family protein [Thiohalomonadales bacterium]